MSNRRRTLSPIQEQGDSCTVGLQNPGPENTSLGNNVTELTLPPHRHAEENERNASWADIKMHTQENMNKFLSIEVLRPLALTKR